MTGSGVVVLLPGDTVRAGWTCYFAKGTIVPDLSLTDPYLTPLARDLCPCLSYLFLAVLVSYFFSLSLFEGVAFERRSWMPTNKRDTTQIARETSSEITTRTIKATLLSWEA
jgi:hypothetical protein